MDDNLIERRREAFEAHYSKELPRTEQNRFGRDGNRYCNPHIQSRWDGWNAALDSAVVELPDVKAATDIAYFNADVVDAIERAGLRVKS